MFNIVDLDMSCPKCGAKVEWQSKDLVVDKIYFVENILATYKLNKRISGEVHTFCDECRTWSETGIKNGKLLPFCTRKVN